MDQVDLVVHDFRGPIALLWAVRNPEKVGQVADLNTGLSQECTWKDRFILRMFRIPGIVRLASATQYWMASVLKTMVFDKAKR